ncbi:LLM class flavin-dependent oxidoreductase, partial [Candidatus Bathyarchaeota archaeon]|nr:LLM class flavin-dependent oxidoreductase [Candidatus Bathyarchaeota archaeon]
EYGYKEILEVSLVADELGFDSLWVGDHFFLPREFYEKTGWDPGRPNKLDAWILLSALAVQTKRIRLGARVSPLPFYDPARLAKIVGTVDIISGGRVNFGVGAGWFKEEAISYGVYWGKHGERISRMLEALEIILKLWVEDGRVTYRGKYYSVIEAPFWPKPLQKPHPPVWFGGSSNAILEATAKYGDGLLPLSNFSIEDFRRIALRISEIESKKKRKILLAPSFTYPDGLGESPDEWLSRVEEYFRAGANMFIIDFSMTRVSPKRAIDVLEEFSRVVFPRYK